MLVLNNVALLPPVFVVLTDNKSRNSKVNLRLQWDSNFCNLLRRFNRGQYVYHVYPFCPVSESGSRHLELRLTLLRDEVLRYLLQFI